MIDYIPNTKLSIKQDREKFSFGVDSILLSSFTTFGKNAIDLGTGNGILILRMLGLGKIEKGLGIEIQEDVFKLFEENIKLNDLNDEIKAIKGDYKYLMEDLKGSFDIAISNPPYVKKGSGIIPSNENDKRSRYEVDMTFEDLAKAANFYLKDGGGFFFSHKPERLAEIIYTLKENSLEPKRIRLVQPNNKKPPNIVLVEARKGGKEGLVFLPTLSVYGEGGRYTEELLKEYGM